MTKVIARIGTQDYTGVMTGRAHNSVRVDLDRPFVFNGVSSDTVWIVEDNVRKADEHIVEIGDTVIDPLDGERRVVRDIIGSTVYMEDGGCMGIDECDAVVLP